MPTSNPHPLIHINGFPGTGKLTVPQYVVTHVPPPQTWSWSGRFAREHRFSSLAMGRSFWRLMWHAWSRRRWRWLSGSMFYGFILICGDFALLIPLLW